MTVPNPAVESRSPASPDRAHPAEGDVTESGCFDFPDVEGESASREHGTGTARAWIVPLVAAWLFVIAAGSIWMIRYQRTPGLRGSGVAAWPAATGLTRTDGQPALIMFVHPRCPCSHASVVELERLVRSSGTTLQPRFVFFVPSDETPSWAETDLWSRAHEVPGAECIVDRGGTEHRRFGALTSGETYLFDKEGILLFQGGVTAGRGEEGDNPARAALARLLETESAPTAALAARTPVFGCSLEGASPSRPCCSTAAHRQNQK